MPFKGLFKLKNIILRKVFWIWQVKLNNYMVLRSPSIHNFENAGVLCEVRNEFHFMNFMYNIKSVRIFSLLGVLLKKQLIRNLDEVIIMRFTIFFGKE